MTALWSCTTDEFDSDYNSTTQQLTVNATFEDNSISSRASLGANNTVVWDKGDEITLFSINGTSLYDASKSTKGKMTLTNGSGTTNGTFKGDAKISSLGYFAVYPYVENTKIYRSTASPYGYVTLSGLDLTTQIAREGSIPSNVPMVAYTNSTLADNSVELKFKNVFAYFKFTVEYNCKSVNIKSNDESGYPLMLSSFTIDLGESGTPNLFGETPTDKSVTLVGENGGDIAPGTYYIAVNPTALSKGFTLTVTSVDGTTTYEKSTTKSTTLARNKILNLGTIDISSIPCLHGKGKAEDPYLISNFGDLQTMQKIISNGFISTTSSEYCPVFMASFKQTQDIDCGGKTLNPIGYCNENTTRKMFQGTYDGQSHTISNITYGTAYNVSALFGYTKSATIKDLNVDNFTPTIDSNTKYVSPLVAYALDGQNTNMISNCHVARTSGTLAINVQADDFEYGGLVARNLSSTVIKNCSNSVNISVTTDKDETYVGGIVGYTSGGFSEPGTSGGDYDGFLAIDRCRNTGSISVTGSKGKHRIGGILAVAYDCSTADVACHLTNCVNSGDLSVSGGDNYSDNGGIVGYMDSDGYSVEPYLINCLNKGSMSFTNAPTYCGQSGIIARLYDNDTSFSYCVAACNITNGEKWPLYDVYEATVEIIDPTVTSCYYTYTADWTHGLAKKNLDLTAADMNNAISADDKKTYNLAEWKTLDDGTLDIDF